MFPFLYISAFISHLAWSRNTNCRMHYVWFVLLCFVLFCFRLITLEIMWPSKYCVLVVNVGLLLLCTCPYKLSPMRILISGIQRQRIHPSSTITQALHISVIPIPLSCLHTDIVRIHVYSWLMVTLGGTWRAEFRHSHLNKLTVWFCVALCCSY